VLGEMVVDGPALVSDSSEIGDGGCPAFFGLIRVGRSAPDGDEVGGVAGGDERPRRTGP